MQTGGRFSKLPSGCAYQKQAAVIEYLNVFTMAGTYVALTSRAKLSTPSASTKALLSQPSSDELVGRFGRMGRADTAARFKGAGAEKSHLARGSSASQ